MTQDHNHALANLATATQSDRTTVAKMAQKIADLTLQLGQANMKLSEAQSSIATLTSKLAKNGMRTNRYNTIQTGPSNTTITAKEDYCWSRGYKVSKGYNGSTCKT